MISAPFRTEADYEAMRGLLRRLACPDPASAIITVGDLDFWRWQTDTPPLETSCTLWLDASGTLRGFTWVSRGFIEYACDDADLLRPMLVEAEARHALEHGAIDASTYAMDGDDAHARELVRAGYVRTDDVYDWRRVRDLGAPIPDAPLPAGYERWSVRASSGWAAMADLLDRTRAAPSFTPAGWQSLMASPTYRDELDLLVVHGGRAVAHCTAWLDDAVGTLLLEPVGCDPDHRRRGLARAVVLEALRRGRSLGARLAIVACAGGNHVARATYESLGFRAGSLKRRWSRGPIQAG